MEKTFKSNSMTSGDLMGFTPFLVGSFFNSNYGLMLVEVYHCPICKRDMIALPGNSGTFPTWEPVRFHQQAARAGWALRSNRYDDERRYCCVDCVKDGKLKFTCVLCKELRDTDQIKEKFGDPEECLCKICFETQTAKAWTEAYDELWEQHKYDHC